MDLSLGIGKYRFWIGAQMRKASLRNSMVAADSVLQHVYLVQLTLLHEKGLSFIAELEYGNPGPEALLLLLNTYLLQQPEADYVLGIKVYKRSGQAQLPAKRLSSDIALLWRRGTAQPSGGVVASNKATFLPLSHKRLTRITALYFSVVLGYFYPVNVAAYTLMHS
jgi:hypothetical protein